MTTLSHPKDRISTLILRLLSFAPPAQPHILPDGRTLDRAAMRRVADLPPHLLKDIGLTDF